MKGMALFCAALGASCAFAGAHPDRFYAAVITNEFRVSYTVSFAEGQKPENVIFYHYLYGRDLPEERWSTSEIHVGFADVTRVYGRTTGEPSGIPFMQRRLKDGISPAPGERRRVEIVQKNGYITVRQEVGGKMEIFNRTAVDPRVRLGAVSFAKDRGTVSDVKISVAGDAPDPRPLKDTIRLPGRGGSVRFGIRPGVYPATVLLQFPDGSDRPYAVAMNSFRQEFDQKVKGKPPVHHTIDDTGLEVAFGPKDTRSVYSITRIGGRYRGDQMADMVEHIGRYGRPASRHAFLVEIRRADAGLELWVDCNFVGMVKAPEKAEELVVWAPAESKYKRLADGSFKDPMQLKLSVPKPFDTSVCRINQGSYLLECDGYLSREPTDSLPDSFLRRVPVGTYAKAVVRCSVDPALTNTCELTARLTNFHCPHNEGRSPDAITWQTKTLARKAGEQTVEFSFDSGRIQDLIHDMGYDFLDFEILGGLDSDPLRGSPLAYCPFGKPSGVTVLGVTLVKADASLRMSNGAYGNVFVAGEHPFVTAEVAANRAGEYRLRWTVKDVDGKVSENGSEKLSLAAGGNWKSRLSFKVRSVGWYSYEAELEGPDGRSVVRFPGSFAVIAPDTRKAGYESPFFTWSGLGMLDREGFRRVAAFFKKVGVRRTQLRNYTEEDAKEFGLTLGECYAIKANGATQEAKEADFERQAREAMRKWPHIDSALILHEWYGSCVSAELFGGKTEMKPDQLKTQARNVGEAVWRAKIWRKVAPQVRLKVGNAGDSLSIMSDLFRGGYPKDLIDYIGEEGVGQMKTPERSTGMAFRNLKDLAEIYGYTNGVAACYEWKSRVRRLFPNARKQAAWFMRDVLIALAWRSPQVTVETGPEIGNSYFNTSWGSGAFTRGPTTQPLPQIAALANLTRILDRCRFVRLVPTGSQTVYLLEFRDPDGWYVYATWTARGVKAAKFHSKAKTLAVFDFYGRENRRVSAQSFEAAVSEEPTYFRMDGEIVEADARGPRDYPWEVYPGLEKRKTLARLDSLAGWTVDANDMWRLDKCEERGVPGSVAAKSASDGGKGCVAVSTTRAVDHHFRLADYGFIRPEKPIPVPDEATTLCLEVKGNSTWGKLMFEIEDADGRRWLFAGPNADYHDLSDTLAFNYDGWHTLQAQIRWESPAKCYSLGSNMRQWYFVRGKGPREITYPVKVSAVGFKLRRVGFDLLNWTKPDSDTVMIRNLSAY